MSIFVASRSPEVAAALMQGVAHGASVAADGATELDVVSVESVDAIVESAMAGTATDLVLLDLEPEENIANCERLRRLETLRDVPVILVTDRDDTRQVEAAYAAGASDYLPRPYVSAELRGRVRSELSLALERRRREARERELLAVTTRLEEANVALLEREETLARQLAEGAAFQAALIELATLEEPSYEDLLGRALRVIAKAINVARVGYWELRRGTDASGAVIHCEALYVASENRFEHGTMLAEKDFPAYFGALQRGETIAAEDASNDPRTSEFADIYLRPNRIGAMLDVPVFVRGALAGVICHEHVGPPRRFRLDERQFAFSVGQVLSLVVESESRRRAEQALRESQAHLETVIDTALDAVITMDGEGRIRGWNQQAEALFGKPRDQVSGRELADVAVPAIREFLQTSLERPERTGPERRRGMRLEIEAKNREGSEFPVEISIASFALSGSTHFSAFVRDITQRKAYERALRFSATHDALTGLANRAHFIEVLEQQVGGRAERGGRTEPPDQVAGRAERLEPTEKDAATTTKKELALVFLDLDRFKHVNDTLGHGAGDDLLRAVADRIRSVLRASDLAARLGGDEFTVLLEDVSTEAEASGIGDRLLEAIRAPLALAGTPYVPSASIGIVMLRSEPGAYASADAALVQADAAMYSAKAAGRGRVTVHKL
ncbi:MAG: diguanylate cyclase [Polyangiaceae bacterium]